MTLAHHLRSAIFVTIGCSSLLVGCGEKDDVDSAASQNDTTQNLDPVPDGDYPECTGEDTKSSGPCCVDVYCYTPDDGDCSDAADADPEELVGTWLGSGTCLCEGVEGPYQPPEEVTDTCCYTVGIQSCEGRPMMVAGEIRTASLKAGSGWSAAHA